MSVACSVPPTQSPQKQLRRTVGQAGNECGGQYAGEPPRRLVPGGHRSHLPRVARASEELLLQRARHGDPHAERLLLELHEPLARQVCRGFYLANGDGADLLQAARIGLWQAIRGWDPRRGSAFRPFAVLVMRREVMMLVSASRARNQAVLNGADSLDRDASHQNGSVGLSVAEMLAAPARDASDPAELTLTRERLDLILAALPALSEHERGSLRMTMNGLSQAEVGAALGGGAKSINNALQRARRKLSVAL